MTVEEAKLYLCAYRPELDRDPAWRDDARLHEALDLVDADPALRAWWERHCAFDRGARRALQAIPVPRDGVRRVLERSRPPAPGPPPRARRTRRFGLALPAAAVLIALAALLWPRPPRDPEPTFATYRSRMIRNVLREYPMSILTNDVAAIRSHLGERRAPADFHEPGGLAALTRTGAGVLGWRTNTVSMVCYDRGDRQMLFLFVAHRAALPDAPGWPPVTSVEKSLRTLSWGTNGWVFLLAGPLEDPLADRVP